MFCPLPEDPRRDAPLGGPRPVALGKFFFLGDRKFYLRGVCYGPFEAADHGFPFPRLSVLEEDLAGIADLGANTLRTFTVPPRWLLDRAAEHGLRVLVTVPWSQHVTFLDSADTVAQIRGTVRAAVDTLAGHPAVLGLLVGNEIPPDIVRWYGAERVRAFLYGLVATVKDRAPDLLVSYASFPPTEYLDVAELVDFLSFNVYIHDEAGFRRYLSRLHNLAEDRPLVLTELGVDSLREGRARQREFVGWMTRAAFEGGAAGAVVFSWTDEWHTGGQTVRDWAFGLVDTARKPKPAYQAVRDVFTAPLPPAPERTPRVSVVVCAFNAERTLAACLEALRHQHYPDYEVVVVNDGSSDRTPAIAEHYGAVYRERGGPRYVLVHQSNRGLGMARNVGAEAASGEIIAYTDADCVPDPDWLRFLVHAFVRQGVVAVGGPNFPPPEEHPVAMAVAVAPGGPTHVLIDDEVAEHIPGCNMAFTREALAAVQGFDPWYTAAGDDVDICWRLQNVGYRIGFSAAAVVWHYRRHTVRAYLRQQRGYGRAEAMLYFRHPHRFNLLGQSRWLGRIYGALTAQVLSRRRVVYFGTFGRGLFQSLYESPGSLLSYLPFTVEWTGTALILLAAATLSPPLLAVALLPLAGSCALAVAAAVRAPLRGEAHGLYARALVALLTWLGPLVRSAERYRFRTSQLAVADPPGSAAPPPRPRPAGFRRMFVRRYWSESGDEKEAWLHGLSQFLVPRKYLVTVDPGWNPWDLEIHRGLWARARVLVATEYHGGPRRVFNVRCAVRSSGLVRVGIGALLLAAILASRFHVPDLAIAASGFVLLLGAVALREQLRLGQIVGESSDVVARGLGWSRLSKSPPGSEGG